MSTPYSFRDRKPDKKEEEEQEEKPESVTESKLKLKRPRRNIRNPAKFEDESIAADISDTKKKQTTLQTVVKKRGAVGKAGSKGGSPLRKMPDRGKGRRKETPDETTAGSPSKSHAKVAVAPTVTNLKVFGEEYPDEYWLEMLADADGLQTMGYTEKSGSIKKLKPTQNFVEHARLDHPGAVISVSFSPDGEMLASTSTLGSIRIWDTNDWALICELRDDCDKERVIQEVFVAKFTPDNESLVAGGKLKDRFAWNEEEDDNQIIYRSPLKIFDLMSGQVVNSLNGHIEEVLCIKLVRLMDTSYLVSCSQDGIIYKWQMSDNYRKLISRSTIVDETTDIAIMLSFVPETGNRVFVCGTDSGIKVYDFLEETLLQSFTEDIYTSYCDNAKFITSPFISPHLPSGQLLLLTRGVELIGENEGRNRKPKPVRPNRCDSWVFTLPKKVGEPFGLRRKHVLMDEEFESNSWMMKIGSNGYYCAAPTITGKVVLWSLKDGKKKTVVTAHKNVEVRDVVFSPVSPFMVTCGDDSTVGVFTIK